MNIQAILFMCNDFDRARFTLENFYKWNRDIPIKVINSGGKDPRSYLEHLSNVTFIDAPNLWHKKTHCGKGSFGPQFADYLFDYGLNDSYTHTLLLETDVLTNRSITIEPKYDMSGPCTPCGDHELILYDYLNINDYRIHTGCGATIFNFNYFNTIKNANYSFFQDIFEKFPENYFMDLILTLAARVHNLSFGHWEEVSNIPGHYIEDKVVLTDMSKTLIHNFKT
jgi:hypothetical protein